PANASNQSVTWHSSNPSVATAVYGVVTPIAAGTVDLTLTTTDGGFTDTCFVTVSDQSSDSDNHGDSGSGRNNSNNDKNSTPNNISINGQEQQGLGTTVTTYENGQTVTTVTVDQRQIEQALESKGSNAVVSISANAESDKVIGELNGQTVKSMEQKQAVLNVSTGDASYTLPAAQINIESVSKQIGQQVELKDIKVTVEVSKTPDETVRVIENDSERGGYTIIAPPVSFNITCTYGDKTIQVDQFNSYVERTIAIPEGVDPQKITTGVIVNPNGTVSHVPTKIVVIDGKYYAKINSLTNSTYSVIWNPAVFSDVTNHWAKEPVNEMGSRKVIGGIGENKFAPDREITRAEFASITMRALGLMENNNNSAFKDVKESDWFSGAVSKTNEYGLISGYTDGTFRPNNKITREEAMAIISKAMNLVGMDTDTTDTETQLAGFKDRDRIGGWAKDAVAVCIKYNVIKGTNQMLNPKENITRAETAAIVMRLLQEAGLI
ncbi:MAG: S-layer homology domain-containing protein, partial [Desulfotomaculaceae bacterium]